jgi:hypothetical protein
MDDIRILRSMSENHTQSRTEDAHIDAIVDAMAHAGQQLAIQWGHAPWSDSWAKQVAETLLEALESTDEPIVGFSQVSGEDAVFCCDCCAPGRPICDRDGHGLVTLGELMVSMTP